MICLSRNINPCKKSSTVTRELLKDALSTELQRQGMKKPVNKQMKWLLRCQILWICRFREEMSFRGPGSDQFSFFSVIPKTSKVFASHEQETFFTPRTKMAASRLRLRRQKVEGRFDNWPRDQFRYPVGIAYYSEAFNKSYSLIAN